MRLAKKLERLGPGVFALVVALMVWVALAVVSHGVDRPPVISTIEVRPPSVARDATATVHVTATDPDGSRLRYEYKADFGTIDADRAHPENALYKPGAKGPIAARIEVKVTDARELSTTRAQIVTIEGSAEAAPPTPEPAPDKATEEGEDSFRSPPLPPSPGPEAPKDNLPPILKGGGRFYEIGSSKVVLEATGMDPNGDRISFSWNFGDCLTSQDVEVYKAQVQLRDGCARGLATLTWIDVHGAQASAEWRIQR